MSSAASSKPRSVLAQSEVDDGWSLDSEPAPEMPLKRISAPSVPSFWRDAEALALPPIAEFAEGTLQESEPIVVSAPEPASELDCFTEQERAFFAQGEELATDKPISIEEFVDNADRELSFWQRFWRR